jgi:hypothetical protein
VRLASCTGFVFCNCSFMPVPVTLRSEASVRGRSLTEIAGSNHTDGMDVRPLGFVVFNVGSGLCDELIIRREVSYRMCVCVCLLCNVETSTMIRPEPGLGCCATEKDDIYLFIDMVYLLTAYGLTPGGSITVHI